MLLLFWKRNPRRTSIPVASRTLQVLSIHATTTLNHFSHIPKRARTLTLRPIGATVSALSPSHTSSIPKRTLRISLKTVHATNTSIIDVIESGTTVGGSTGRYGKYLPPSLHITPKKPEPEILPEPIRSAIPRRRLSFKLLVPTAIVTEHHRSKTPRISARLRRGSIGATIGYDEQRIMEELEVIRLALESEDRGYTQANIVSYHQDKSFEEDLEAILLACKLK